ncbi:hypothetical protein [Staphylococcus epidermidis]|uniref:hypothetical protein n=1 Tax=Staphylococcus epidermidis TaxID=1282 RepID=UPI0034E21C65
MSLIISFLSFILSIFVLLYTNKRHQQTMLDNLDSKSDWRKTLFKIAGKSNITMDEVYQLRAAVRFAKNNDSILDNSFEYVTNLIIDFSESMNNLDNLSCKLLNPKEQEMVRVFCRYLLTNQWEVLQLTPVEQYKINKDNYKYNYSLNQNLGYGILLLLNKTYINERVDNWRAKEEKLIEYTKNKYKDLIDPNFK